MDKLNKTQQLIRDYNNLTWKDKAKAIYSFHKHKQSCIGMPIKGHDTVGTWNIRDTAKYMRMSVGSVSEMINIAKSIKLDSSITDENTLVEALHITGRRLNAQNQSK